MVIYNNLLRVLYLFIFFSPTLIIAENTKLISQPNGNITKKNEIRNHINSLFNGYNKNDKIRTWNEEEILRCYVWKGGSEFIEKININIRFLTENMNIMFEECKELKDKISRNSFFFLYFNKNENMSADKYRELFSYFSIPNNILIDSNKNKISYAQILMGETLLISSISVSNSTDKEEISDWEIKRHVYSALSGMPKGKGTDDFSKYSIFRKEEYTMLDKIILEEIFNLPSDMHKDIFLKRLIENTYGRIIK